jgi:DNA mismatch endonuclease (patch repair protein)
MGAVHSSGTAAERSCEAILRSLKIKFRRNAESLPGKPDFVLSSSHLVIFVHGCFWHSHDGCKNATVPTSNTEYWSGKLVRNRRRDRRVREAIRKLGWRTVVIWECKLRDADSVARRLMKLTGTSGKELS